MTLSSIFAMGEALAVPHRQSTVPGAAGSFPCPSRQGRHSWRCEL